MSALNIYPSFQWTTGQTMTAQLLNNPLAAIQAWSTTIDNTNLTGGAGIFASQIVPLNTAEATFGGAVGYTIAPGSTTQVPLTLAGVVGQAVDLFDVLLTPGGIKPFSVASTGAVTALAGASGVTPLTVSGVGGQSSDLFDVTLTSGGIKAFSMTSIGGGVFLAGATTTTPLTVSGIALQTADIFDITNVAGGTPVFSVSRLNNTAIQALIVTPSNAPSFPGAFAVGDGAVQRTSSTGFEWWGGAVSAGGMEWNITNGSSFSLRNSGNTGYVPISGGPYTNASDASLKANPKPVADALASALALKPVSFTWKENGQPGLGFLAQDVQAVLPDLVSTDNDGIMGVNYDGIIPVCVSAIQELSAQFTAYVVAHP